MRTKDALSASSSLTLPNRTVVADVRLEQDCRPQISSDLLDGLSWNGSRPVRERLTVQANLALLIRLHIVAIHCLERKSSYALPTVLAEARQCLARNQSPPILRYPELIYG